MVVLWWSSNHKTRIRAGPVNMEGYRNMRMIIMNTNCMMIDDGFIVTVKTISRIKTSATLNEAETYDVAS